MSGLARFRAELVAYLLLLATVYSFGGRDAAALFGISVPLAYWLGTLHRG